MNNEKHDSCDNISLTASLLAQNRVIPVLRDVIHDLNNSVWSSLANLEIFEKVSEQGDDSLRELLASIRNSIERASHECRRATDVLKSIATDRESIDLSAVVANAVRLIRRLTPSHCDIVHKDSRETVSAVISEADVVLLLWNLTENAIAAIGKNQGTVSISVENGADGTSLISVADNGCGMSAETLADCQKAFSNVDKAKLGIGLASVAEVMFFHRGKVTLESELGVGTTFRMYCPSR